MLHLFLSGQLFWELDYFEVILLLLITPNIQFGLGLNPCYQQCMHVIIEFNHLPLLMAKNLQSYLKDFNYNDGWNISKVINFDRVPNIKTELVSTIISAFENNDQLVWEQPTLDYFSLKEAYIFYNHPIVRFLNLSCFRVEISFLPCLSLFGDCCTVSSNRL